MPAMARRLAALSPNAAVTTNTEAPADGDAPAVPVDDVTFGAVPAGLGARLMAYALDSVILFAFTMLFATASFLNIYLGSDSGRDTASDGTIWRSVYMLLLTVPGWFVFNLLLTSRRGYTIGQYVMGLRLASADEAPLTPKRLAAYWVALHPLLFHPMLAGFWLLFAWVAISISENDLLLILGLALAMLCILAPLAGLAFALLDRQHRAVHDRLAGVHVTYLD
jgi:uncharacterized RDD family membrane protein YckC